MKIIEQSAELVYPATRDEAIAELKRIEAAGRNCWRSEGKITDDSYLTFIKGLLKRGHESPLEFANFTFKLVTSRDVMAELTRHRMCSFAIESQRYVNESKDDGGIRFIRPEYIATDAIKRHENGKVYCCDQSNPNDYLACTYWIDAMYAAEECYNSMINVGMKNQDARKVLPNSTATTIFMSCNLRELLHIMKLRESPAAYPEIRKLMSLIRAELIKVLPEIFAEEEKSDG